MSDIKCIIFDWGGVLVDNPVEDIALECSKMVGADVEQLKKAYAGFAYQFERGNIKETKLWKKIGNKLNISIKNDHSIWYECFKKIYSPRSEIFDLAKQLKQNGFIISLLSNTEIPAMNFFNKQKYDMFNYTVFSCNEGFVKPEPELYKILLHKISIPSQQTLFIDDKFENIETAKSLKMNAIQYINKDDLFSNLRQYNITI